MEPVLVLSIAAIAISAVSVLYVRRQAVVAELAHHQARQPSLRPFYFADGWIPPGHLGRPLLVTNEGPGELKWLRLKMLKGVRSVFVDEEGRRVTDVRLGPVPMGEYVAVDVLVPQGDRPPGQYLCEIKAKGERRRWRLLLDVDQPLAPLFP